MGEQSPLNFAGAMPLATVPMRWTMLVVVAFYFFFSCMQMAVLNDLSPYLTSALNISALSMSKIAAAYFVANTLLLYPVGFLLDRMNAKPLILFGLSACIISAWATVYAHLLTALIVARIIAGGSNAFCLLSILRLAARWFPDSQMGKASGIVVTIGMLGGVIVQSPLLWFIHATSWRHAMWLDASIGLLILCLIAVFVHEPEHNLANQETRARMPFWHSSQNIFALFSNMKFVAVTAFIALMNLPLMCLSGLFGLQYFINAHHISSAMASIHCTCIFIGMIIGSTVVGVLSDHFKTRKHPMRLFAMVTLISFLAMLFSDTTSPWLLVPLSFLLGFGSSAQVIGYPVIREICSSRRLGSALGLSSIFIMIMPAIFDLMVGYCLSWRQSLDAIGKAAYVTSDYHWGFMPIIIAIVIAVVAAWYLPETFGEQHE